MLIGVPKEIKDHEYRVGLTPAGAYALVQHGHEVLVERGAGARVGFPRCRLSRRSARGSSRDAADVWAAEMVVKVKELQEAEFGLVHRGQVLFAYLHLAPEPALLDALLRSGVSGIAYETVDRRERRPATARADVAHRRQAVDPVRRVGAADGQWRQRRAAGGVPGVAPGQGGGHRCGRRGRQRGPRGSWDRRRCDRLRSSTRRRWRISRTCIRAGSRPATRSR